MKRSNDERRAGRLLPSALALLLAVLLAAVARPGFAAAIRLPEGPGVNLAYAKCQTCHDLQYLVDGKGLLPAQWRAVLGRMQSFGMKVNEEEKATLLEYLTTYLGPNPPPATPAPAKAQKQALDGKAVFMQNCATCHGREGRGQPGYFPPLANNPDLHKDRLFPVLVVLNGLAGPIEINGAKYNGVMPPFGHLSNAEVAAVVNYVREAWGEQKPAAAPVRVTPEAVAAQRKRALTPAQVHDYRTQMK